MANGQFDRIAREIVGNLGMPDVVALQEVQDGDGSTDSGLSSVATTLQALVGAIVAAGGPRYAFLDNPFIRNGTNGGESGGKIRTAFLYNPDRVDFVEGSLRAVTDTLLDGAGNDVLAGGLGHDTFVFGPGGGDDRVLDFAINDRIRLVDGARLAGWSSADLDGDTILESVLEFEDGSTATLMNFVPRNVDGLFII